MAVNIVERIDDVVPVRHALVSVSNKSGLESFVPALVDAVPSIRILSTGGTYTALREILGRAGAGERLVSVSDYTGQPEMQGGLVKTLDFKIYLGLLSETYNDAHAADLQRTGAVPIDLVVANLYPFRETIARSDATAEHARANIDIGGPCMIRAAAKNFLRVAVAVRPEDYPPILKEIRATGGGTRLATRYDLARKAFAHTAAYDAAISEYLNRTAFERVAGAYAVEAGR